MVRPKEEVSGQPSCRVEDSSMVALFEVWYMELRGYRKDNHFFKIPKTKYGVNGWDKGQDWGPRTVAAKFIMNAN